MTNTPIDDQPGFIAGKLEHCFGCFQRIRPGQTCYVTIEHAVLCASCALDQKAILVREHLAVEVKRDWPVARCGEAEVKVLPGEVRHLVDALAEAAVRVMDQRTRWIGCASACENESVGGVSN